MSNNPGPGPIPGRFISKVLSKAADYVITAADLFGGNLILKMNAAGGQRTVTMSPTLGSANYSPTASVLKVDTTNNPVVINDGSNDIDAIVTPATALGQIGGWRDVSADGSILLSRGVG